MATRTLDLSLRKAPSWYWGISAFGVAWNIFGVKQFIGSAFASEEHMMSMGMTNAQAELYANLPLWMPIVFAIGVFGGLVGWLLLLMRLRLAVPVLFVSMAGYAILYAGDMGLGVFAAFGAPQVAVLTLVMIIAALLLVVSLYASRHDIVR